MSRGELAGEQHLVRAARGGDEAAWQVLYDAAFDRLYRYARWRCGGLGDLAEEVVQETWLTAVRRLGDFDSDRGSFLDWLRGIAANVVRNRLRREQRRATVALADTDDMTIPTDRAQREQAESIAAALAQLPERYEAVLRAKYLDGLSVEEIASAWSESAKGVESLLTRARQAFRVAYPTEDQPIGEGEGQS